MRKTYGIFVDYLALVCNWTVIVDRDDSFAVRQEACLTLLQILVQNIATVRIGQLNASLRFYADMLYLKYCLVPSFEHDELGDVAMHPSYSLESVSLF